MTHPNDLVGTHPHVLAVLCPQCQKEAQFYYPRFSEIQKEDIPYFDQHPAFEYVRDLYQTGGSGPQHFAMFYPGLVTLFPEAIQDLPSEYSSEQWIVPDNRSILKPGVLSGPGQNQGSIYCPACHFRSKIELDWPEMAFYKVDYRGDWLWAYSRETWNQLYTFIASTDRNPEHYDGFLFLLGVPKKFLSQKARPDLLKKMERFGQLAV